MRLVISDGKIEFAGTPVIEHINFDIKDNSKIAIIGRNGSGKTSLLKVIEGELDLTFDSSNLDGYINRSNDFDLGYLKQISFSDDSITLEESVLECYKKVIELEKRLSILEKKMETDLSEKIIEEYSKAQELFENMDGYYYQKEYNMVLKKFGFTKDMFSKPLSSFSGGERTKIAFVKLLLSKPDLLLLDEPTNHLDLEAIEWLEEYLKNYKKAFIVVSHDREFINHVAKEVYEIEYNTLNKYSGNYDEYLIEKETRYKTLVKEYEKQQREIEHQQELIDRFRYKATKAKMVQSRIKQLDKLEIIEPPKMHKQKTFKMNINPVSESGKEVLTIRGLEVGYNKSLAEINLDIYKGEKIAIIGENGSGKSTILKTIMGMIKPISGKYKYGFNVKIGYFDQQVASIVNDKTILQDYMDEYPFLTNQEARNDLGCFLFSGKDVDKKLNVLSGGEIVRLSLAKIFKKRPNLLILDEPTNHMDIVSKETIEKMLKSYKGTVIFVSHDRYFVRKISDSLLSLDNGVATYYPYGYSQYISKKEDRTFVIREEVKKEKTEVKKDRNTLKKELTSLEKLINEKEQRMKEIELEFEKEEVYSDFMIMQELENESEELEDEIQSLTLKWEEIVVLLEEKSI